jgi:hypothetical protein
VDGISDQSLPAWDGAFGGPFTARLRAALVGAPESPITIARYVVQWDAMSEASAGPDPGGDYRERFEAWLRDVGSLGLVPVVALTSYDGVRPAAPGEYTPRLQELLQRARAIGTPIAYLEPWNEPNNQGHEGTAAAAALANAANAVCASLGCGVIAGGFEDAPGLLAYELAYQRALTFTPSDWGVHPYFSVLAHDDSRLLAFRAALPDGGRGARVWFTEIGALYCSRGEVRGERRQAGDAAYLVDELIPDPAIAPVHVIYYALLYADRRAAPCAPQGGADSELFAADGRPRAAAAVVFGATRLSPLSPFGPGPGGPSGLPVEAGGSG